MRNVVTIGGGGGHAQVLKALKTIPDIAITAVCGSTDSGGSSGILKRDYGSLGYLGDLTRCVSALCPDDGLAQALLHRFDDGCFRGHSVKNMLLFALERVHDSERSLELMHRVCGIESHRVMPVTREQTELCAHLKAGNEIEGETNIDNLSRNPLWNPSLHAIKEVFLKPIVGASERVLRSIVEADRCIVCPGDLYSSIIPVLMPDGMMDAFGRSRAKIVVILNVMTKNGETNHYRAEDFIDRIEAKLGKSCDAILYNTTDIEDMARFKYRLERKVQLTSRKMEKDPRLIKAPLAMMDAGGRLFHDPTALAVALTPLLS